MADQDKAQYGDDPKGLADRWTVEMNAAKKDTETFMTRGDGAVKRFLDERDVKSGGDTRVNLYSANVMTLRAMLYGKLPQVDVGRRFADPGDDVARLAGEILKRLLNMDIQKGDDTYAEALGNALDDRLIPGLGVIRLRYEVETKEAEYVEPILDLDDQGVERELAPGYQPEPEIVKEEIETDYVHWRDFRWSPCRVWSEVRWIAFKAPLTREACVKRFGEVIGKEIPMNARKTASDTDAGAKNSPWARADVWEIWSKEDRKVYWWIEGMDVILDVKDDPLTLDNFFPAPRPMFANVTTTKLVPQPDFIFAQDLYDEVDSVSSRITLLERAISARGVYDKSSEEIKRLLSEAMTNELIPVEGFAIFKEKGGLQSVVDWLPIENFVMALDKLREYRTELMGLLFQVTGMSDIMRGQASQGATATEQALKAKFASVRVQEFQNEFARFASDAQAIKAEIISKHYSPETIATCANVQFLGAPPPVIQQAIGMLKSDLYQYRVEVKPESVAAADMAAVKQERSEFLMSISQFLQSAVPVIQVQPYAMPYLLQLLQWSMAGFRGGATAEGVLDQMVMAANQFQQQQMQKPPPPDPNVIKMESEKQKMMLTGQKHQMDMQAKVMDLKLQGQKHAMDIQATQQKHQMDLHGQRQQMAQDAQQAGLDHEVSMAKAESDIRMSALKEAAVAKKGAQSDA
jgi:hypothetical protein